MNVCLGMSGLTSEIAELLSKIPSQFQPWYLYARYVDFNGKDSVKFALTKWMVRADVALLS